MVCHLYLILYLRQSTFAAYRLQPVLCALVSPSGRRNGPVPVAYVLHGRWSVVLVTRRPQQPRAAVSWVAAQLQPHAQPAQLVRAFRRRATARGDAPARRHRIAPPRPEDASRPASIAGGAAELALICAEGQGTLPVRAKPVARVVRAETARVRPGAPTLTVAFRAVITSLVLVL